MTDIPHAVYRLYDAEWTLLYVGVTVNLPKRMAWHACQQSWWPQVAHRTSVWYGNEWDGRKAEAEAIDAENPVHNDLKPAVGHHAPPHGQRKGWHRTDPISWHSADPAAKPWVAAEAERRGVPKRAILDEMATLHRARREGDHAKYAEIVESIMRSFEGAQS